ncbi:LysR family transcriptional regulator [Kiloniella laminariae]|uniref:LysR family transcriptional regulator n=1 Tax=Kiloniella laminariae TaxID=454162 RepID=A0ABT4LM40_9PROT|nr:LysR family transcriptional regulator [Kiloniella laminariae]MCZ4282174.1 LysR family transcriptional regulator [Kiloniella laminariae]
MGIRHLRTLLAIAEAGSFQAAAERLGLTHSAISMQMKAFEEELQSQLFDRSRRPPDLSPAGKRLLPKAREILALYESLSEAGSREEDLSGLLRLGAIPSATASFLPEALAQLGQHHPRLQIRLESGLSTELTRELLNGKLDCIIITQAQRLDETLKATVLRRERLVVVACNTEENQKVSQGEDGDIDLLNHLPFVRFNHLTGVGKVIEQNLRSRGASLREVMELDSLEAIQRMVAKGLGAAIIPESGIGSESNLLAIPFGKPVATRTVSLVEKYRGQRPDLTQALAQTLFAVLDTPELTTNGSIRYP